MKKFCLMLGALLALTFNGASAHPDHDDMPPQQLLKLDFAKKRDGAIVYLTSYDEKISTAGASGTLTVVRGKQSQELALKPVGVNGMETAKPARLPAGARARATVTTADKATVMSEFLVK